MSWNSWEHFRKYGAWGPVDGGYHANRHPGPPHPPYPDGPTEHDPGAETPRPVGTRLSCKYFEGRVVNVLGWAKNPSTLLTYDKETGQAWILPVECFPGYQVEDHPIPAGGQKDSALTSLDTQVTLRAEREKLLSEIQDGRSAIDETIREIKTLQMDSKQLDSLIQGCPADLSEDNSKSNDMDRNINHFRLGTESVHEITWFTESMTLAVQSLDTNQFWIVPAGCLARDSLDKIQTPENDQFDDLKKQIEICPQLQAEIPKLRQDIRRLECIDEHLNRALQDAYLNTSDYFGDSPPGDL